MALDSQFVEIVTRGHADAGAEPHVRPVVNVYTFKRPSGLSVYTKPNITTAFVASIATDLQPTMSVSYITDFVDVRMLDDPLDPYLSTVLVKNGTVAGDSLPSINNVTLQLKTGFRGRTYRGSKHYGPIAEADTTLDRIKVAPLALWVTFAASLLAGFTDADGNVWTPFLVSRKLSTFTPTVVTIVGKAVNEISVNQTIGMMRRRRQPTR